MKFATNAFLLTSVWEGEKPWADMTAQQFLQNFVWAWTPYKEQTNANDGWEMHQGAIYKLRNRIKEGRGTVGYFRIF